MSKPGVSAILFLCDFVALMVYSYAFDFSSANLQGAKTLIQLGLLLNGLISVPIIASQLTSLPWNELLTIRRDLKTAGWLVFIFSHIASTRADVTEAQLAVERLANNAASIIVCSFFCALSHSLNIDLTSTRDLAEWWATPLLVFFVAFLRLAQLVVLTAEGTEAIRIVWLFSRTFLIPLAVGWAVGWAIGWRRTAELHRLLVKAKQLLAAERNKKGRGRRGSLTRRDSEERLASILAGIPEHADPRSDPVGYVALSLLGDAADGKGRAAAALILRRLETDSLADMAAAIIDIVAEGEEEPAAEALRLLCRLTPDTLTPEDASALRDALHRRSLCLKRAALLAPAPLPVPFLAELAEQGGGGGGGGGGGASGATWEGPASHPIAIAQSSLSLSSSPLPPSPFARVCGAPGAELLAVALFERLPLDSQRALGCVERALYMHRLRVQMTRVHAARAGPSK
jgi:hypothetical protein